MEFYQHSILPRKQVELVSGSFFIKTLEHAADLANRAYLDQVDHLIIHDEDINIRFYQLRNGFAEAMLQKFLNYHIRISIVGDYALYKSKSIQNFIYECNQHKQVRFVKSMEEAIIPD